MLSTEENKYYVYALIDPVNKIPFYIGKGCGDRMYHHLKNDKTNIKKVHIIEVIRSLGLEPIPKKIAENLDEKSAYQMEYEIIKSCKRLYNIDLVNRVGIIKPPSRKGCKVSEETKQKIRLAQVGRKGLYKMSDEQKLHLSKLLKGKEGPNKKYVDVILLKSLYVDQNHTKDEICSEFNIGLGSLNRILHENSIFKTKDCFASFGRRKL